MRQYPLIDNTMTRQADPASPTQQGTVTGMQAFDPAAYGPELAALLAMPAPDGLVHGPAVTAVQSALENLDPEAIGGSPSGDMNMARACLAALWLRFDFGERGHTIAQSLGGKTGDYWHATHHRREPDYANAKYWLRRVGHHDVHGDLLNAAHGANNKSHAAATIGGWGEWDAFGFTDLCARHAGDNSPDEAFCKIVQTREWELLFSFGYGQARGIS